MPKAELTIKVRAREDLVPVRSFLTVVQHALSILKDLEHGPSAEPPAEWKVSAASLQSPLSFTIGSDASNSPALVREYLAIFEQTESSIESVQSKWSERVLQNAKSLVSVLNDGISQITFATQGTEPVSPTQRVAATVDYFLAPAYEDYGTLEGRLETLSVHGKTRFNIYDPLTGRAIACYFPIEQLEEAHAAFPKRVAVSGRTKYSRMGNPVSIHVESIRVLEGDVQLSQLADTDLTGGMDSGKYVRGLRDG